MNEPDDVDFFMSISALDIVAMPLEEQNEIIDKIIAYQRAQRAIRESGVRVKKPKPQGPPIDLVKLGLVKKPTGGGAIRRRV